MYLPNLKLDKQELSEFNDSLNKEWLITNGIGGYSSSTTLGVNTRKYHGLLVAALHPPGNRTVCLEKIDEEINIADKVYLLGANEFGDAIFPEGFMHLERFSLSPFPTFLFNANNVEVLKTIFMPNEENVTIAVYRIQNKTSFGASFKLFPLNTCRYYHTVNDKNEGRLKFSQNKIGARGLLLTFEDPQVAIAIKSTDGQFVSKPNWIDRLFYREEALRGESSVDDCYQPGYFQLTVPPNDQADFAVLVAAGIGDQLQSIKNIGSFDYSFDEILDRFRIEQKRNVAYLKDFYDSHPKVQINDWLSWILLATSSFIVRGFYNGKSVVAGYHWFEAWGRDTFISLPGLMLTTHRFDEAKKVLLSFNKFCKTGLIPNFLNDQSLAPSYNTVDATMWYVNAIFQYLKYTGDFEFVQDQLWETLKEIVEKHVRGTSYGIHLDDGLLAHGPRLTWMDAEVGGKAVTPRAGKAVEIQALWYNVLKIMETIANRFNDDELAEFYLVLSEKTKTNFTKSFWNGKRKCLFDVIGETGPDASLRPNQIIAVSLDFSMLDRSRKVQIVDIVTNKLLTPCGLRTLEENHPEYVGKYQGDRSQRDKAYHNGTVWPWLLGPFTTAYLKAKGDTVEKRRYACDNFIEPLFTKQIWQAGMGTISEIFDGNMPNTPGGCIAQAWSIAEPLRAYIEDIMQSEPRYAKEILISLRD